MGTNDMNARTPADLVGEPIKLALYDFGRWKPVTPEKYLALFSEITFATAEGHPIVTKPDEIDETDGELRLVTWARVQYLHDRSIIENEPYLAMQYDPNTQKHTLLMMRKDVQIYKDNLSLG